MRHLRIGAVLERVFVLGVAADEYPPLIALVGAHPPQPAGRVDVAPTVGEVVLLRGDHVGPAGNAIPIRAHFVPQPEAVVDERVERDRVLTRVGDLGCGPARVSREVVQLDRVVAGTITDRYLDPVRVRIEILDRVEDPAERLDRGERTVSGHTPHGTPRRAEARGQIAAVEALGGTVEVAVVEVVVRRGEWPTQ